MGSGAKLSTRLRAVADLVPRGARLADIGCDHALLPIWLLEHDRIEAAIGIDINPGPLELAARLARGVQDRLDLRMADGLAKLAPGEASVVSIAGMGGARLCSILAAHPRLVDQLDRLVLQPNTDWTAVRTFVMTQRMDLVQERIVEDRDKFYVVLEVNPRPRPTARNWDRLDLIFGPLLRRAQPAAFGAWLEERRESLEAILDRIADSGSPQPDRVAEVHRELDDLKLAAKP